MDKNYWNSRWEKQETGWDVGHSSPALTKYINGIQDKNISILIPGCGNAHEAEYLIEQGFDHLTLIDIAEFAVDKLKEKYHQNHSITLLCEDFFEHKGTYDLILEQTFFCAIPPHRRSEYAQKTHSLLKPNGKVVGVLFDREFGNPFPPFGGSSSEYKALFEPFFKIEKLAPCYNSIPPRDKSEVFIEFVKQ